MIKLQNMIKGDPDLGWRERYDVVRHRGAECLTQPASS